MSTIMQYWYTRVSYPSLECNSEIFSSGVPIDYEFASVHTVRIQIHSYTHTYMI
jgi:hypothetical protein